MTVSHLFQTLGLTVLHMLWIGALIGGVAFVWLRSLQAADPRARYACAVGGLMMLLVGTGSTFAFLASTSTMPIVSQVDAAGPSIAEATQPLVETTSPTRDFDTEAIVLGLVPTSMIAWGWIIGIALMSVRLFRQWIEVRRLRVVGIAEPSADWARMFDTLKSKIGIHPRVPMLVSHIIDAPMVVGWLRPLVLVPASAFTSLTPDQLQTVLAHELHHIARRDHLVNMLQAFIEVLLFFHPVTWWLSSQVRIEREHCCDDGALLMAGSPRKFAEALLVLESLRSGNNQSHQLLTATGGSLMHRVSRLFESNNPQPLNVGWRALSTCTFMAVAGISFATAAIDSSAIAQDRGATNAEDVDLGTFPSRASMKRVVAQEVRNGKLGEKQGQMIIRAHERVISAIEAGRMSPQDAEVILRREAMAAYTEFNGDGAGRGGANSKTDKVDLEELKAGIEARIKAMGENLREKVAAGEISEADAKARFEGGEQRMWARYRAAEEKNAGGGKSKLDYDAAVEKMTEMVKAGTITREQMQQRLDRMKQADD